MYVTYIVYSGKSKIFLIHDLKPTFLQNTAIFSTMASTNIRCINVNFVGPGLWPLRVNKIGFAESCL